MKRNLTAIWGTAALIYVAVVFSFPRLFSISLDRTVDQIGNRNIAILANLALLGVIGIFGGVGTLVCYVVKRAK